ncbi:MAG: malonate decarboxylase acyl carrier protein [Rhodocyclaceae bacterium]|nr:malonate decarboxylase acyl carrier protein [Rhodocyclaceae bacterium]
MERFEITLPAEPAGEARQTALAGVVSSGNLEVLVETGVNPTTCTIEVSTSAHGFRDIWEAVLGDFAERHPAGGLRIAINDAGATPAVVSLRLSQAFEDSTGDASSVGARPPEGDAPPPSGRMSRSDRRVEK